MTLSHSRQKSMIDQLGPLIDELFNLATTRNLDLMLRRALGLTTRLFQAEAGSILFQANSIRSLRTGSFEQPSLTIVNHWENLIRQQLQDRTANKFFKDTPPVSTLKLESGHLVLNSPILRETKLLGGCISLVMPADSQVSQEEQKLLTKIALSTGQMASLVADLELAQRRVSQMSVFYQVGQALVTNFDLKNFLLDTMELATNVVEAAAASLMLLDEANQELVFEVTHGARGRELTKQRIPLDEGIAGWVVLNNQPVLVNNVRTDPRFSYRVDARTGFLTQSIAAVPLTIKGKTIGVLEVLNKYSGTGFVQEDLRVLSSIAAHAAIAIENARLYDQVREEHDLIVKGQSDLRQEIIRNLHDGPIQYLSAISMNLDYLEHLIDNDQPEATQISLEGLHNLVRQATRETRHVISELRPVILETQGLVAALRQYVQQLRETETLTIHFDTVAQLPYETDVAGTIFSIIQEAMTNVKRHAQARQVWLAVALEDDQCLITLRDDGYGFDVQAFKESENPQMAYGLMTMEEQAKTIEAVLRIDSRNKPPNRGTTVSLKLAAPSST